MAAHIEPSVIPCLLKVESKFPVCPKGEEERSERRKGGMDGWRVRINFSVPTAEGFRGRDGGRKRMAERAEREEGRSGGNEGSSGRFFFLFEIPQGHALIHCVFVCVRA